MRNKVSVKAFAKVNLSIDVLEKMDNGYHRIKTVMQQIDLFDDIEIESLGKAGLYAGYNIKLETNDMSLPKKEENLAFRAAKIMAETFFPQKDNKILIKLNKKIPVAAGLAGGSSDAAAVMLGLCRLWNIDIKLSDLCAIGTKLGADVPFCLIGNAKNNPELGFSDDEAASSAALAEGIGEILSPIKSLSGWLLLVCSDISVMTKHIYEQLSHYGALPIHKSDILRPDTDKLIMAIKEKNIDVVLKNMVNVLETVSLKEYPIIVYTKNKIIESGVPLKVLMSGSGPTVFGYYDNEQNVKKDYSTFCSAIFAESEKKYDLYMAELL